MTEDTMILNWEISSGGAWVSGPYMLSERIDGKWNASALFGDQDGNLPVDILLGGTFEECKSEAEKANSYIFSSLKTLCGRVLFNPNPRCGFSGYGITIEGDEKSIDKVKKWYHETQFISSLCEDKKRLTARLKRAEETLRWARPRINWQELERETFGRMTTNPIEFYFKEVS